MMREIVHSPVVCVGEQQQQQGVGVHHGLDEDSDARSVTPLAGLVEYEEMVAVAAVSQDSLWRDQLLAILVQEESYRLAREECRFEVSSGDDSEARFADPPYHEWRTKICQWSFKVIDHFRMDREVVSVAMNILDRFLVRYDKSSSSQAVNPNEDDSLLICSCSSCTGRGVDSRTFQLAAMTALFVAFKVQSENRPVEDSSGDHGGSPLFAATRRRKLKLASFVELSRGQFGASDILDMERLLLSTLEWKVHPPTPMTVVSYLLKLLPRPMALNDTYDLVLHVLQELARYLTELSVCLASTVYAPASHVAYAAIVVGMDMLTYPALPMPVRDEFHESVVLLSAQGVGGTILTPNDEPIQQLQDMMRQAFWPELLLEDVNEKGHPLALAREHGILAIDRHSNRRARRLDRKPGRKRSVTSIVDNHDPNLEVSPVSVSR